MDGTAPSQLQLLDGQGNFDEAGLVSFAKNVNLAECGLSYAVVSIMGPQSSGKSTLLNHLFHTKFTEMDAFKRRGQTTQGVWLAQAVGVDPCTLVMDLEGTDGRERGEDDTTFEKQSALFALAVSDVMLINMWCHDIGREQAANKPLLKTIFQVMMRLFTPRKSTLLFVIRDKTKTPLEILEPILREDVQKIWDSVPKPEKHKNTPLSDFFNVDITDLPSFEEKEEQFKEQVAQLRQRFFKSIVPGGLAGDRSDVVPGNGFPLSIHEIWKVIKENKDLDLPAHTVMVATVRCEEIAYETLRSLKADKDWCSLEEEAQTGPISGFGKKLSILLDKYLSSYDAEANFFDASVRSSKRKILLEKALEVLFPSYQAVLGHYRSKAFNSLKQELESGLASGELFAACVERCTQACLAEFDYGSEDAHVEIAGWDATKTRDKLRRDVDAHLCAVKAEKLSELSAKYEKRLEAALIDPVASLLDAGTPDTWQAIRKLLALETEAAKSDMAPILAGYELDKDEETAMLNKLHETGRVIVEKKAKDEATQALSRMKDRFSSVFSHDADSMPRIWSGKEDMRTIIRDSRLAVLKLISTLAVLRLEERKTDKIESVLTSALLDSSEASADKGTSAQRSLAVSVNLLASSSWQGIPAKETLITPVQCKNLWRQFRSETEYTISQALAAQEASKRSSSWLPPPWAIAALLVLGFNEFMTLLRNPIYLAVIFVAWLLGKAIWVQLDIAKEFQVGFVPGVLSLSARFLPTIMGILKKLAEEGQKMGNNGGPANNTANHGNYTANGQYKPVPLQDMASYTSGSSSEVLSTNGEEYSSPARERQPQHPMYS